MRFGGRDQVTVVNPDDKLDPAETAIHLYAIERQAGFSILTNTVVLWIAATTYLTAAFGLLALLRLWDNPVLGDGTATGATAGAQAIPHLLLYWLPFPACALAGYHVILYDMQASHSQSIAILEKHIIVNSTPKEIASYWKINRIGSKAETDRTEWAPLSFRKIPVIATGIVALLVPYVSAILLTATCLINLHQVTGFCDWVYTMAVALYAIFGLSVFALAAQSTIFLFREPKLD